MQRRSFIGCWLVLLCVVASANGQSRSQRKERPFKVALQPFSAVRAAVHAIAEPIVERAPRAIARAATAPARVAAFVSRPAPAEPPHPDAYDGDEFEEPVYRPTATSARIRPAEPVQRAEAFRVAYVTTTRTRRAEPVPNDQWDGEEDFDGETPRDEQGYSSSGSLDDGEADEADEVAPEPDALWPGDRPTVSGSRAVLRNGIAYAPSRAPQNVKNAIWAVNGLQRKPYRWGGGHASFHDRGYDCSGAVSYALHYAGALSSPLPSTGFIRYGRRGRGRWITIYSRRGHTFAIIAGLRLDTTDFQRGGNTGPRWHVDGRETRGFAARHPAGL